MTKKGDMELSAQEIELRRQPWYIRCASHGPPTSRRSLNWGRRQATWDEAPIDVVRIFIFPVGASAVWSAGADGRRTGLIIRVRGKGS